MPHSIYLMQRRFRFSHQFRNKQQGLNDNQNRLLYLFDLHTKRAQGKDDTDLWIRKQALSVIIYEGIISDVFDYDYAPTSTLVDNRRVWCNISQEGQSDVEFLREEELISALMLSSRSYKQGVCYQISDKGQELVNYISRREKEVVDAFAHKEGTRELLKPAWDDISSYWMESPSSGYRQKSSVTETEDVSYVSSAYIPQCLRYGGRPTMSNAHKAHSSGFGAIDTIRDTELDEVITLNSVSLIVAEFVPFGSNQIVQLNNTIGSNERVQGGYICSEIDDRASETTVEMNAELTSVDILDYTLTNHINFEAEIRFPEDPGIVQVETFGISLNAEGTCFYGMQIEAVMDRIKDKISLDHLSRILVDVQQDSTRIVDSVISQRQRDLLDLLFLGDSMNRNKINLIVANEINPHLTAEEYMDKGEFENELKQIIGDTKAAYDISEKDTLIFGAHGLLVCGPHARSHEPLLCAYMQFITLDIFLQNYFSRMWTLKEDMEKTDSLVDTIPIDPNALDYARERFFALSKEVISLEEILGYVSEALQIMEIPPEPQEQSGRSLYDRLEIMTMRNQLIRRNDDLKKIIKGSIKYMEVLEKRISKSTDDKIAQLNQCLEKNNKSLETIVLSNKQTSHSTQIFRIFFSAIIAFDILDRITGDWTVLDTEWMETFVNNFMRDSVLAWFCISMFSWLFVATITEQLTTRRNRHCNETSFVRIQVHKPIRKDKLLLLLEKKEKKMEERGCEDNKDMVKVTYKEVDPLPWGGTVPVICLEYDERNSYLYQITIQYERQKAKHEILLSMHQLRQKVIQELEHQQVFHHKSVHSVPAIAMLRSASKQSQRE